MVHSCPHFLVYVVVFGFVLYFVFGLSSQIQFFFHVSAARSFCGCVCPFHDFSVVQWEWLTNLPGSVSAKVNWGGHAFKVLVFEMDLG